MAMADAARKAPVRRKATFLLLVPVSARPYISVKNERQAEWEQKHT